MSRFLNDEELIKALKGSRLEMFKATSWIMNNSGWDEIVAFIIYEYNMDLGWKDEVFLQGITELAINVRKSSYKKRAKPKVYFEAICRNMLKTILTKKVKSQKHLVLMDSIGISKAESINTAEIEESNRQIAIGQMLDELIGRLKGKCKPIMVYLRLGYSLRETSEILGIKYQFAKNNAPECRQKLRAMAENSASVMKEINTLI